MLKFEAKFNFIINFNTYKGGATCDAHHPISIQRTQKGKKVFFLGAFGIRKMPNDGNL